MVGGTGRKGVRVRRLAVTDRGDEPVFIVGLFCIPFFIDGKGVVKEAVFVLKCTLFTGHPVRRVHFALYD